jgi:hypothetical protein
MLMIVLQMLLRVEFQWQSTQIRGKLDLTSPSSRVINTSSQSTMSTRTPTLLRTLITSTRRPLTRLPRATVVRPLLASPVTTHRKFTTTTYRLIDLLPDADKPDHEVKESEPHDLLTQATPLTDAEYQEKSDAYIEDLLGKLETMQEEKGNMDVEYSVSLRLCFMYRSMVSIMKIDNRSGDGWHDILLQ